MEFNNFKNMKQLKKFLGDINSKDTIIQIGTTKKIDCINGDDIESYMKNHESENLYFLGGVNPEMKYKRAKDCDITQKRYMYFDFDIRKDGGEITDEEIKQIGRDFAESAKETKFKNWSYIVFSGNGLHIYFIGDTIKLDKKQYALGYEILAQEISNVIGCEADPVCKNLARIARLPLSYNNKSEKKLVDFVAVQESKSNMLFHCLELGKGVQESKNNDEVEREMTQEIKENKNNNDVLEQINRLPIQDEVLSFFPTWDLINNGRNFMTPTGNMSAAHISDNYENVLMASGSREFQGINKTSFTTFSFVKHTQNLSSSDTFKYFEDKYTNIKTLADKERKEWAKENGDNTTEVIKKIVKKDDRRYTWGTKDLNENFALIKRGVFMIMAAEQGVGKTTFAFFQARENAKMGNKTLYLSLEMDNHEIADFLAREYAGITEGEEYNNEIPAHKQDAYERKKKELGDTKNLILSGVPKGTPITMDFIRQQVKEHDPDMVYIDNFDLVGRASNDTKNDEKKSAEFMNIASVYQIPVIALHHVRKKSGHNSEDNRTADDIRGSGKITDDADRVVMLGRLKDAETEEEKALFNLTLVKARGYNYRFRAIYFNKGDFQDEKPEKVRREEEFYGKKVDEANKIFNN